MSGDTLRAINKIGAPSLNLRGLLAGVSAAALMAMSAGAAHAADWRGLTSSDWTDGSNWSEASSPVSVQPFTSVRRVHQATGPSFSGLQGQSA
ncbi:hypothetical protein HFO45_09320 [Rhizobium leguminosarum]|uniref:hypothetical protein n=1 Tax=Rhizobium leguminosarum TaxID=384 RepID=UPI001C94210F|nr:hypothetical protein [Rhizobium leguminosarum]MBY5648458.1 hypothetical protein [Rhizobium leguminosarum]